MSIVYFIYVAITKGRFLWKQDGLVEHMCEITSIKTFYEFEIKGFKEIAFCFTLIGKIATSFKYCCIPMRNRKRWSIKINISLCLSPLSFHFHSKFTVPVLQRNLFTYTRFCFITKPVLQCWCKYKIGILFKISLVLPSGFKWKCWKASSICLWQRRKITSISR